MVVNNKTSFTFEAERIAFYPQRMEAIKLRNDLYRSEGGIKRGWTKPRSRTEVSAMGIVKQRSGAPCGERLARGRIVVGR